MENTVIVTDRRQREMRPVHWRVDKNLVALTENPDYPSLAMILRQAKKALLYGEWKAGKASEQFAMPVETHEGTDEALELLVAFCPWPKAVVLVSLVKTPPWSVEFVSQDIAEVLRAIDGR